MTKTYDVVVVGGGVIGSSVAYFLAAEPSFDGSIVVVEKDPTYTSCSTTLSAGSVRQQFSTVENIEMSKFGSYFIRHIDEFLAVDGEVADVQFVEQGYLFLVTGRGLSVLKENVALQRSLGVDVALLSVYELGSRFPWLRCDDLCAGSLGLTGEGWFDPYTLLMALKKKAQSLGVTFLHDEVTALRLNGSRIMDVTLRSAGTVGCSAVVNAAGPGARAVAQMASVDLPVRSRKRFVYVIDCRETIANCPMVIDPSGVYVRPEGNQFICGVSPPEHNDPDCFDFEVDHSLFEDIVWPTLANRVPAFEAIKLTNAWAGHYEYNTLDQNAIIGAPAGVGNLFLANGFSGHGLQQSPAVGRAISESITFGEYRTLDLSRFGYERVVTNSPIKELNVV
ncbi:MAG: FAD-binding oxidoreductase [Gammaproteobacteria bacterium]|nr:FAD-binding oxidoreductase [Gammaproteobacteria bacterium]